MKVCIPTKKVAYLIIIALFSLCLFINESSITIASYTFEDLFERGDSANVGGPWTEDGQTGFTINSNTLYTGGARGQVFTENVSHKFICFQFNTTTDHSRANFGYQYDNSHTIWLWYQSASQLQYYNGAAYVDCGAARTTSSDEWLCIMGANPYNISIGSDDSNMTELCQISTTYDRGLADYTIYIDSGNAGKSMRINKVSAGDDTRSELIGTGAPPPPPPDPPNATSNITYEDLFERGDSANVGGTWTEDAKDGFTISSNTLAAPASDRGQVYDANVSHKWVCFQFNNTTDHSRSNFGYQYDDTHTIWLWYQSTTQLQYYDGGAYQDCGGARGSSSDEWLCIMGENPYNISIGDADDNMTELCQISTTYDRGLADYTIYIDSGNAGKEMGINIVRASNSTREEAINGFIPYIPPIIDSASYAWKISLIISFVGVGLLLLFGMVKLDDDHLPLKILYLLFGMFFFLMSYALANIVSIIDMGDYYGFFLWIIIITIAIIMILFTIRVLSSIKVKS